MESLGGLLFPLLILLLFIPIFLSGRKQRRQMQEMQQLQSSLEVGDVVTTTSGLRGTVVDVSYEDTVDLEIAEDVVTTWMRAAVRDKVADTPADPATDLAPEVTAGDATAAPVATAPVATAPVATGPVVDGDLDRPARTETVPSDTARADAVRTDPADAPSDANGTPRP